jgi:hypothetical protein
MENYLKAKNEFNQKLDELKKETNTSIYAHNLSEIVLYEKLLELQEEINGLKKRIGSC